MVFAGPCSAHSTAVLVQRYACNGPLPTLVQRYPCNDYFRAVIFCYCVQLFEAILVLLVNTEVSRNP